jgi:hypothetical protein
MSIIEGIEKWQARLLPDVGSSVGVIVNGRVLAFQPLSS